MEMDRVYRQKLCFLEVEYASLVRKIRANVARENDDVLRIVARFTA